MKLWVDGKPGSPGVAIRAAVKEQVAGIGRKAASRGTRAVNALRNAELEVLKGQRHGRRYRKPHTKNTYYTASAPGEAPARRTGNLRMHWNGHVESRKASGNNVTVIAVLESQEPYAAVLESGTGRMRPRPFCKEIKEKALPEIRRIYNEPYV